FFIKPLIEREQGPEDGIEVISWKVVKEHLKFGGLHFLCLHISSMASTISEMTIRVLGPEEQPKSAGLKQVGRVFLNMFLIVSSRSGLVFDMTVFWSKISWTLE